MVMSTNFILVRLHFMSRKQGKPEGSPVIPHSLWYADNVGYSSIGSRGFPGRIRGGIIGVRFPTALKARPRSNTIEDLEVRDPLRSKGARSPGSVAAESANSYRAGCTDGLGKQCTCSCCCANGQ